MSLAANLTHLLAVVEEVVALDLEAAEVVEAAQVVAALLQHANSLLPLTRIKTKMLR